MVSSSRFSRPY
ncbi:hypothetical protein ACHAWC_010982 [Mediolabrus comicus]